MRDDEAAKAPLRHVHNAGAGGAMPDGVRLALSPVEHEAAVAEITSWPGYAPTPLVSLPGAARAAGVAAVLYKDEAHRFDLASFKALGGAYAVLRVLQERLRAEGHEATATDLIGGAHRDFVSRQTVACATDGNHGRSVAWGAQLFGCRCFIYLHQNVSADREAAIAAFGATIVRTPGDYDASVRQCGRDAESNGWALVADTNSGGGPDTIPLLVMQGYTLMVREMLDQLDAPATHVFIPAGVGGLAAAVSGHWAVVEGDRRPRMIAVEPHAADCVYRAIDTGTPAPLGGDVNSFMACLSAGEVSPVAWPVLQHALDDVVTIPDDRAIDTMRALASGRWGDPPLVSGESGCAALAALLAARDVPAAWQALGLGPDSRVVVIGSEGATAPDIYERIVGRRPQEVA
ncbi:diaminopropionate ammonia-lyase [Histidinibacterium lentulum]|nr:diaminopropionate ammonia-lyase [Histidinibacterium lentulum]